MTHSLLLVSADTSFAQLLLHGLEQEGYLVHIVKGKGEAVVRADEANCSLAFLDMDLGYRAVLDIGGALRMLNPGIRFIIFAREGTPAAPDELRPWLLSPKPYFLPDVLNMLNNKSTPISQPIRKAQAAVSNSPSQVQTSNPALPWLQDVTKAAQHLTRLTLESSAQAALITRGDNLWAYAGQLSQGAAKELAVTVTRHWDGQKGSDLLRFVRLEATKAEHMLYATRIADDVVLALVFDAETPFSTIRTQAGQLAQSLSIPGAETTETPVEPKAVVASYDAPTEYIDEDEDGMGFPNISDILSDVPPPIPTGTSRQMEEEDNWGTRPSPARSNQYSRESSPAVRVDDLLIANQNNEQTVEHVVQDFDATMPSKSRVRPETPIRRPMPGELDETRPHSITEVAGRVMLEPISPGLYNLTYACLLVPRFSSHYLTGDMSDRLSEWLPQICIAFGWRLEFLAVRPEYVQWVVNVPPATSPGYLMRIMRQQTSEKIFTEFTRMKKENPSGDFWAPGYLIMGGTQPHPPQLVKDYIKQTRTRQGYS
ncbi:MAG TPA: IS200/IS605 family transposase [Anaerolineales bacterium]|nr:IS200/IS605 family transposase [Anaerolineales bacterium]